jgi:hypothetical protein
MSHNPYAQVALTYVRRPFSSPQGWAVSAAFAFMSIMCCLIFRSGGRHDIAAAPLYFPLSLAMLLFGMFGIHVKDQFANSRARLTPGFHRAHAMIAAAAALLMAVLLPTMLIWLAGLRSIGLVALMVFLLGAILCSVTLHSNLLSWLIIFGFFATFTEPTKTLLWQVISGQVEAWAVAILALGAASVLLGGIKLVGLNEDMPAYHPRMRAGWAARNQMSGQTQAGAGILPRALQERFMENNMARWTNHVRRASTSPWSRACRWQVGMLAGWSALLLPLVLFFFFAITVWMTGLDLQKPGAVFPLMMFSIILPGMFWGSIWRGRIPMLGREILLPVDRPSYVRQLGMAVAVGQLQLLAGMSFGLTIWLFLTARQPFSFTNLAFVLGIITLLTPWFFGVGVWFLRYRNLGMQMGGLIGAVYVSMIPAALYAAPGPLDIWKYSALPLAGIIGVFGLLLTYDAYRRWLVADFD